MDAGATSWLMLGSLIRIPLLAEATNVRAIVAASILFRRRRVLGGHPANLCMSASRDDGVSDLKGGCSCGGVASLERARAHLRSRLPAGGGWTRSLRGIADEECAVRRRRGDSEMPTVFKVGELWQGMGRSLRQFSLTVASRPPFVVSRSPVGGRLVAAAFAASSSSNYMYSFAAHFFDLGGPSHYSGNYLIGFEHCGAHFFDPGGPSQYSGTCKFTLSLSSPVE